MLARSHVNLGFLAAIGLKNLTGIFSMPGLTTVFLMLVFNLLKGPIRFAVLGLMVMLCVFWPERTIALFAPLSVLVGSLFPDIDHPNSTGSVLIAPTAEFIRAIMIVSGAALIYLNWMTLWWAMAVGGVLIITGVLNLKWYPAAEKLQRLLLILAGVVLIITSSKTAVVLGFIYLAMGVLSHRGLTHSIEGLIICSAGVFIWANSNGYLELFWPFVIGYATHLLADMVTASGIYISYFGKLKFALPLVNTSGITDRIVATGAMAAVLLICAGGLPLKNIF